MGLRAATSVEAPPNWRATLATVLGRALVSATLLGVTVACGGATDRNRGGGGADGSGDDGSGGIRATGGDAGLPGECARGQLLCAGECIDPNSDPHNCGACGSVCAGSDCGPDACFCDQGRTTCLPGCGESGHCSAGVCDSTCGICGNRCIDLCISATDCGACGVACAAGRECVAGECTCPPGQTVCDGNCVDLLTDRNHCGECDTPCCDSSVCSVGICTCACSAGLTCCTPEDDTCPICVDVETSAEHCGGCNLPCPPGQHCDGGRCVPAG